jgi:RHS repeat-associated protein
MTIIVRLSLLLGFLTVLGLFATNSACAQGYYQQFGQNPWTAAIPVPAGYVDAANGNLHLEIPVANIPQRGHVPFVAKLVYDSHIWQEVTSSGATSWQATNVPSLPVSWGGWRLITSAGTGGGVTFTTDPGQCEYRQGTLELPAFYTIYKNFNWVAPDGHSIPFGGITEIGNSHCAGSVANYSGISQDGRGYHIAVANYNEATVYAPDGTQVYPRVEDTNGNYFTAPNSNGDVTDTRGEMPITTSTSGSTVTYSVLVSSPTPIQIVVTTESIPVYTQFGVSGVTDFNGNITVISNIAFPDGSTYQFNYDSGTTAGHYGTLTSMTMPAGGVISFESNKLFSDAYGNPYLFTEGYSTTSGAWSFTPTVLTACGTTCSQQVVVERPSGDEQLLVFTMYSGSMWLTQSKAFTGSVTGSGLLETTTTTYNTSAPPFILPTGSVRTLPTPTGTISSQTTVQYDSSNYGNIVQQSDWNFYPGAPPSSPYRTTVNTYLSNSDNYMVNKKSEIQVEVGAGPTVASTTIVSYDSAPTSSLTGVTNHDDTNYGTSNNARGNPSAVTVNGIMTSQTFDMTGQATSFTDAGFHATQIGYADYYFDDSATGPTAHSGSTNTNAYPTKITNPLGWVSTTGYYWGSGKLATAADYNGASATQDFMDPLDRQTQTRTSIGWSKITYSVSERDSYRGILAATPTTTCPATFLAPACAHAQSVVDSLGRISTQTLVSDPEGADTTTRTYDSSGRVVTKTNPERTGSSNTDGSDSYTYDGLNRVLSVTHSSGGVIHFYYGGNVTSSVGGNTSQLCPGPGYPSLTIDESGKKSQTWVDAFGRTIEADEPDASNNLTVGTCYEYDIMGNLVGVVQGSQTRSYSYDSAFRLSQSVTPESGTVHYYYTTSGGSICSGIPTAVCRRVDARSITTTYTYDALNRLTGTSYSGSTPSVTYTYDAGTNQKGFRTGMSDGSGNAGWTYNVLGWPLTESRTIAGVTKTIGYSYNQDGSIASVTYPSGRIINYTISSAQRLLTAADLANGISYAITAGYEPPGQRDAVLYGQTTGFQGIQVQTAFNGRFEPSSATATSSSGTAQNVSYTYNMSGQNNGNVTSITNALNTNLSESFTYDNLDRINTAATSSSTASGCWGQSYGTVGGLSDDRWSNLTQVATTECSTTTLGATASATTNQLSASGFGYDLSGNMTGDGSYTYTFDGENRLVSAAGTATGTWTYVYDGNGLRVEKSNASGGTLYFRSYSGKTIAETDLSGNIVSEYVFFGDQRIARRDASNNVYYYYFDQVGSTVTVTNSSGTSCYDATFSPYGQEFSTVNTCPQSVDYKFAGYERDAETGLDYAFARYYDSRLGRFLSPDPYLGALSNPQTLNRYAYVANNPLNITDPTGLYCAVHVPCKTGLDPMFFDTSLESWGWWVVPGGAGDGLDAIEYLPTYGVGQNLIMWSTDLEGDAVGSRVSAAIQRALLALQNPKCAGLFGSTLNPSAILEQLAAGSAIGSIGTADLGGSQNGSQIQAETTGGAYDLDDSSGSGVGLNGMSFSSVNITINSNPDSEFGGAPMSNFGGAKAALDAGDADAETIIHELGHAVAMLFGQGASAILQDGDNNALSRINTAMVVNACFGGPY